MDVIKKLLEFDEELYVSVDIIDKIDIFIVGGSALYLHKALKRHTYDIDVFFNTNKEQLVSKIMEKYDINTRAAMFIGNFPHDYKSRVEFIELDTKIINVYVLSIEDIVISKLVANRFKDLFDIKHKKIVENLKWDLLNELKEEKIGDLLNQREIDEFIIAYDKYVEEFKK